MAVYALEVIAAARDRLDDHGGDTGTTPAGYYAYWQYSDAGCLWRNTELTRYLNQTLRDLGQRQPLLDDTRARYTMTLVAGTRQYAVPAEIVRIESVIRASDGEPLAKATVPEMQAVAKWHRHQRELLADDWRSSADNYPTHYLLDEKHGYLTVYPTPSADYLDTLYLVVRRTFLTEVDWTTLGQESTITGTTIPDVPDHAFDALVAGMCARAYLKRDADTQSPQLAAQCEAEFTRYAGPPRSLLNQEADARWADNPEAITPRTWLAR